MKISNPIFKELRRLNLISEKNLEILSSQTRDKKNLKVLKDLNSGIIFLEKYLTNIKYYSAFKFKEKQINRKEGKIFSLTKLVGKKIQ